jgi:hypothetical protein
MSLICTALFQDENLLADSLIDEALALSLDESTPSEILTLLSFKFIALQKQGNLRQAEKLWGFLSMDAWVRRMNYFHKRLSEDMMQRYAGELSFQKDTSWQALNLVEVIHLLRYDPKLKTKVG